MKHLALVMALVLGGCATNSAGQPTVGGLTQTQIIAGAQQAAVGICGFLPTAATVVGILTAGNPAVATAEAIASAICAAVVPVKLARKGTPLPTVAGVPVHGRFVN